MDEATAPGSRHVAMVLYGDLTYDSRVRREARSLASSGFRVTIACLRDTSDRLDLPAGVAVLVRPIDDASATPGALNPFRGGSGNRISQAVARARWLLSYVRTLRTWGRAIINDIDDVDLWHANDLTGLAAIGPFVARPTPIVYDVHDLVLDTGTALRLPATARRLLRRYERHLVRRVAALITVNDGLAAVLRSRFPGTPVTIVHNCPDRWDPVDQPSTRLRDRLQLPAEAPIVLYHGGLGAGRGIEPLFTAIEAPGLESTHLVLLGFGDGRDGYARAAADPSHGGRIHVLDAVPPGELLAWVASADVGAVTHPGIRLNDRNKTPNKLFEALAAGIPVVASDFPLMRAIVLGDRAGPLGAMADPEDPSSIADALRSLLDVSPEERALIRTRCRTAARERWNWETEVARLVELDRALSGR